MYTMGVPIGMYVDHQGPRPVVLAGSIILALGYFPLHEAYDMASGSVPLLCFFSYLTGAGGCMAFAAAVKTSALNWPDHRGTATAFPLAAFGLSAFFFSFLGSLLFSGDPSKFLMLLAVGTCSLTFVGFFFLKVYPQSPAHYSAVPNSEDLDEDQGQDPPFEPLSMTSSAEAKRRSDGLREPGTLTDNPPTGPTTSSGGEAADGGNLDETSSLMSTASGRPKSAVPDRRVDVDQTHTLDIRGFKLLRSLDFWQLFLIMGILAGIGLMTIKYVQTLEGPHSLSPRARLT